MRLLFIILAIILFPPAALSMAVLINSYDKFNWGSISDWLTLLITISFGFYAIIQWRKPKIDSDVYELEKKIVVYNYSEIYDTIEKETSLINSHYLYFQIINRIFPIDVNPTTSAKKIFSPDLMFQKKLETENLQNIAKKVNNDLKIIKKLGREFTCEMDILHKDYDKLCRDHFIKISMLWDDIYYHHNDSPKIPLTSGKISEMHKKKAEIDQSWNQLKIKNDEIYNYSPGFSKYFKKE